MNSNKLKEMEQNLAIFKEKLNDVIEEIGNKEILIGQKEILKYCELLNDENKLYFDEQIANQFGFDGPVIPPSYIMNITNPVMQILFIRIGQDFFQGLVKGVIHVSSIVNYYVPMLLNKRYKIKVEATNPVLRMGTKGKYYSVIIKLSILSEDMKYTYATDDHEFFFKI